jgi:hypothetical protein
LPALRAAASPQYRRTTDADYAAIERRCRVAAAGARLVAQQEKADAPVRVFLGDCLDLRLGRAAAPANVNAAALP